MVVEVEHMRIGLGLVAFVCVCLLISSVTAVPAVAWGTGVGVEGYPDTFTAGLAGRTIGLESFSNSTEFRAGDVRGIDIQIGDVGRGQRGDGSTVEMRRDGIFTITHGQRGSRVSRSGLDEQGIVLVEGLQAAGFEFDGAVTDPYETTISCGAVSDVDPKVLSASGLRRSTDTTSALVGSGRVTTYRFTNTSTGRPFELTVTQPTDEHGNAVGNAMVSTPTTSGGRAGRSVRNGPSDTEIAVIVGGGTGAVAGVGVSLGLLGGAATVTEATALLGTMSMPLDRYRVCPVSDQMMLNG